ncbi:MAG: PD40 domain-containing protein [Saprospiraceae bacterium]|nr:PD40 domain-containing protein [Saprospiraceae bacterium]
MAKPELLAFCDAYSYLEPFISADGSRLYFASNRPKSDGDEKAGDFDIWYVNREPSGIGWSAPINAGNAVNTQEDEFYPVITANFNLYLQKTPKAEWARMISTDANGMGPNTNKLFYWMPLSTAQAMNLMPM